MAPAEIEMTDFSSAGGITVSNTTTNKNSIDRPMLAVFLFFIIVIVIVRVIMWLVKPKEVNLGVPCIDKGLISDQCTEVSRFNTCMDYKGHWECIQHCNIYKEDEYVQLSSISGNSNQCPVGATVENGNCYWCSNYPTE